MRQSQTVQGHSLRSYDRRASISNAHIERIVLIKAQDTRVQSRARLAFCEAT